MTTSSSLFDDSSFPSITDVDYPWINGTRQTSIPNQLAEVTMSLTDGTLQRVFNSKRTALRCLKQMLARGQWMLQASDDIIVVAVGDAKLLVCEATLVNQKLFASFIPQYIKGRTSFVHRSMSQTLSLGDALQSVGFCLQGSTIANNNDLVNLPSPPRILIVDWNYVYPISALAPGSLLTDETQIMYDYP